MNSNHLFRIYVEQRKAITPAGYNSDTVSGVTRYTPTAPDLEGIVMFSELSNSSVEAVISDQISYFDRLGLPFEWKVYDLDTPSDLAERLSSRGFEQGASEGFLVLDVGAHRSVDRKGAFRIERISSPVGVGEVVSIQEKVWGRSFPWLGPSLMASLERSAIFCAYLDETPVGTGWIEFPSGSAFAELHGGSVLSTERKQGIYSALFDIRIEEAKRRGIDYIAVDAAPMSRPILLKKGFTYICDTIPFRKIG